MHNKPGHKYFYQGLAILVVGLLALPDLARAEAEWFSFTWDNDCTPSIPLLDQSRTYIVGRTVVRSPDKVWSAS